MFVIAGVTGHVGSVVAHELLAGKQKVRVIVRDAAKGAPFAKQGAEVAIGALDDAAFLTTALKGATGFFTLLPPDLKAENFYTAQRKMADAIAHAVRASGVGHVVILSSVGADLESGTGPIKGLHYLEKVLRETGTILTAVRAGSFQENVGMALGPARTAGIFPSFFPSADFASPMIATKDIGALAAKSLLHKPVKSETVDLLGPSYSQRQLAEKLGAALGKTLKVVDVPEAGWVGAMMQGGFSKHVAEVFAEMYGGFASGRIKPCGDRMETGTTPIDSLIKSLAA